MKVHIFLSILPLLSGIAQAFPTANTELAALEIRKEDAQGTKDLTLTEIPPDDGIGLGNDKDEDIPPTPDSVPEEKEVQFLDEGATTEATATVIEDSVGEALALGKRARISALQWLQRFEIKRHKLNIIGNAVITISNSGRYRFFSYVHNSGWFTVKYSLVCGTRGRNGRWYTFERRGTLCGRLRSCSKTHKVDQRGTGSILRNHWDNIVGGNMRLVCELRTTKHLPTVVGIVRRLLARFGSLTGGAITLN